jgi:hypothetical protein
VHLEIVEDALCGNPPISLVENILGAGVFPEAASGVGGEPLDGGQLHPGTLQIVVGGGERFGPLDFMLLVVFHGLDVFEAERAHDGVADDEAADSDLREHELDQLAAARLHLLARVHLGAAAPRRSAAHR